MSENGEITCTIDGIQVTVPKGTPIIEAAAEAGIYIPRFCYHRLLRPYGGCRMCLVDIVKGSDRDPRPFPKPEPACMHPVQEGMEVRTDTERVHAAREGMMEFTLVNHPLDCPICDQGGECDLQDIAYLYGREDSRFHETKIFKLHRALSSLIVQDYNRCILCKRCIRWTQEVADDDRLVLRNRGAKSEVATFNGQPFVSRFGGMTIELCPVGALTSRVFRFKARAWEVSGTQSTCSECAMGCAYLTQHRGERIMRFVSLEDPAVNGPYFCDRGRFAHDYLEHPDRIVRPLKREGGRFAPVGWDEAAEMLASECKRAVQDHGPRSLAACIDPSESLESLWSFARLFRDGFATPRIEHSLAPLGLDPDDMPGILGRLATIGAVLRSKHIVMWECDPFDDAPVLGLRMKLARERGEMGGVSVAPAPTYLGRKGIDEHIVPHHRMRSLLGAVAWRLSERCDSIPDELQPAIASAREAAANLTATEQAIAETVLQNLLGSDAVLLIGSPALRSRRAEIAALLLIARLTEEARGRQLGLLPMFRGANSLAAMILGLRTQLLKGAKGPGMVGFTGESVLDWPDGVEKGEIRAVFAVGDGLIEAVGLSGLERLASVEFLSVVTDFMNPLAARANMILPRLAPWETSGTLVNLDGGIRRMNAVVPHPTGAWSLERFFAEAASHLNLVLARNEKEIHSEIAENIPAFRPLAGGGSRLERPQRAAFRLGGVDGAFKAVDAPDGQRFGVIVTETIFQHDTRGKHAEHVAAMPEDFCCGMNRSDADRLGLTSGDLVRIQGESGQLEGCLKIVSVPDGYVMLPVGFIDSLLAELDLWRNPEARVSVRKIAE